MYELTTKILLGDSREVLKTIDNDYIDLIVTSPPKLNDDELHTAKKCVEWGLSSIVDITMKSAIEEAVYRNR